MERLNFILRYINYYLNAKSKYKIHSPFIFELLINVIYKEQYEPEYEKIEEIRKNLLEDERYVEVNDLGAKGRGLPCRKRIKDIAKSSSSSPKYCKLLSRLIRHLEPKTLIELGTSLGISTMYEAVAAEKGKVITIEGSKALSEIANENFKQLGLTNAELITDSFDNALPKIIDKTERADYVFFDGNHRKDANIRYFELCAEKISQESVFIFDDIHWSKEMEEFWKYIQNHPKTVITIDLFFMGLVFFPLNVVKQNHMIRF